MFYPIRFWLLALNFSSVGKVWIPAKTSWNAEIEVELVLGKLLSVQELAAPNRSVELTKAIERRLNASNTQSSLTKVMQEAARQLWAVLAGAKKNLFMREVEQDIPKCWWSKMSVPLNTTLKKLFDIKETRWTQLV